MLPGLRSDLLARPPASSSVAVRPSKFPLASFCHLPLRLSCPHVPRQPAFLPSPTSSSRPPAPRPVPYCCPRVIRSCPVPLDLALSVAVVRDKRYNKSEKKKEESKKKNSNRRHTCRACLPPCPFPRCHRSRPARLLLYSTEKEIIGKERRII